MVRKVVWTLSVVCFAMSTLLSLVGIISVIQLYFHVSIYYASLYASVFAGALGVSSLITLAYFARFEKKRMILFILAITAVCNLVQLFIDQYYIALIFRIIPAIFYPVAVSSALTIIGKISPNDTNKVVLGISAGSIVGLSVTSYRDWHMDTSPQCFGIVQLMWLPLHCHYYSFLNQKEIRNRLSCR